MESSGDTYNYKDVVGIAHQNISVAKKIGTVKDNAKVVEILAYF